MFTYKPTCSMCKKDIQSREEIFVKMKYPAIKAMTEIKAYLKNNGEIICNNCYESRR